MKEQGYNLTEFKGSLVEKVGDMILSTKHEQILRHISSLQIGSRISVRQIARDLKVSEGTAYRAIKEAENRGLVSTIERVGTIRIEEKLRENLEQLTFAELINIVEGHVLGGKEGLHKTLSKFLIGAMELEAMKKYTEPGSLMIVGNRTEVHELALKEGVAVLITGGFDTTEEIKQLADEKELPIISTSYDTYTVAEMINRAIYDQLIIRDIVLVSDVYTPLDELSYLRTEDSVGKFYEIAEETNYRRFPVVDGENKLCGIVTEKDVSGAHKGMDIKKLMTKKPIVVQPNTSVAYVAHMMVWEGVEVVPVVSSSNILKGLVSRRDALEALQQIHRQPQVGDTIDEIVTSKLTVIDQEELSFQMKVIPQMTNQLGTLSSSVLTSLITHSSRQLLLHLQVGDMVVENLTIFFIKPIQIDDDVTIKPRLLEAGRIYAKVEVELTSKNKIVGKGLLMAQVIER